MGTVLLVILDHLRRIHGDSAAYSISMWLMEFLVLGLIAYEVLMGILERRMSHIRKRTIDERVQTVREAISKGQQLERSHVGFGSARVAAWSRSVTEWKVETQKLMASYSPHTEASFLDVSESSPENVYSGFIGAPQEYSHLLAMLKNLRGIIEKPEVYL